MLKIGDLVEWRCFSWLAIVLDDQEEEDDYGIVGMHVQWVTGDFIGEEEFIPSEELEKIA